MENRPELAPRYALLSLMVIARHAALDIGDRSAGLHTQRRWAGSVLLFLIAIAAQGPVVVYFFSLLSKVARLKRIICRGDRHSSSTRRIG